MIEEKLNRLKEVLSVPTHSMQEDLMIDYLDKVLTEKGYDHTIDAWGNVYVTKGQAEYYPCFVAHTDTVHDINENLQVVEGTLNGKKTLRGIDSVTKKPSGIGGDDKCGVYLCLEMLDKLDNVKIALFVSEEIGCRGSQHADPDFFKNVGYVIQYDSPGGDSMSLTLMGRHLFGPKSEFATKVTGLITEHGITDWARHPYTDVWQIVEKFDIACLNLAAGYYKYHTDNEYVIVDDVQNGFELGLKLVEVLGEERYTNKKEEKKLQYVDYWSDSKPKTILNETKNTEVDSDTDTNSGEFFSSDRSNIDKTYGYYRRTEYGYDEWYGSDVE